MVSRVEYHIPNNLFHAMRDYYKQSVAPLDCEALPDALHLWNKLANDAQFIPATVTITGPQTFTAIPLQAASPVAHHHAYGQVNDGKIDMAEFAAAVEPAMKYLNERFNPHARIIIERSGAEIVTGLALHNTNKFVRD